MRLHWTDQPYVWHVNDGIEVLVVLDGAVDMHYRDPDGQKLVALLDPGTVFVAEDGDEHVARPRGTARILVIEHAGSICPPLGENMTAQRQLIPPFTRDTALRKVQVAEDAWNTRDPEKVAQAYTIDTVWRNRDQHVVGRDQVIAFLTAKWQRELDYRLRKNLCEAPWVSFRPTSSRRIGSCPRSTPPSSRQEP